MYDELVKQINKLLNEKELVIIAISGHGGSGKSTLADKLANDYGVSQDQIVRTDNMYAKNHNQTVGIFELHDWSAIIDLLASIRRSNRLSYLSRSYEGKENKVDVKGPHLVILEGIRLIRPEILPYIDLSVWIDYPLELATKRAKDRNRQQNDSEDEIALWDTKWVPEAKQYQTEVHPEKIADFIYTEQT